MRPDQENNHLHLAAIHSGKLHFLFRKRTGTGRKQIHGKALSVKHALRGLSILSSLSGEGKNPRFFSVRETGTVIPPEDDRIDFPSSYRETGPAA